MLAFLFIFVSLGRLYRDMFKQPETRALVIIAASILVVGVLFYTSVEHWTLLDALYFCVVTLGTVGYGDITPKTAAGKIFTMFYIVFGLVVIGGFLAAAGRAFRPEEVLSRRKKKVEEVEPAEAAETPGPDPN